MDIIHLHKSVENFPPLPNDSDFDHPKMKESGSPDDALRTELQNILVSLDAILSESPEFVSPDKNISSTTSCQFLSKALIQSETSCALAQDLRRRCFQEEELSQQLSLRLQKSQLRQRALQEAIRDTEAFLDGFQVPPTNAATETVCQLLAQKRRFDESARLLHCTCIASALCRAHSANGP